MKSFESRWSRAFPVVMGVLFGLAMAMLIVSIFLLVRITKEKSFFPESSGNYISGESSLSRQDAIVGARRRVSPSVVSVTAYRTQLVYASRGWDEWFQQFRGRMPTLAKQRYPSYGSGVIVNPDGYILTNEHVIRDAEEIYVTMTDSTEVLATLIGRTPEFDLALLRIEGRNLPFAPLGDSDQLEIGETVIAIGSPFTYLFNDTQPTVTAGVISALHRDVKQTSRAVQIFKNMIQTDAVVNPGNSGGPLVSADGLVVGINTFIFSSSSGSSNIGMGFAIPVNTAKMVIDELRQYGRFRNVWTGLIVKELTPDVIKQLAIPFNTGLVVAQLEQGGPAEEAGIEVGDVIIEINGKTILDASQAERVIFGRQVGDDLEVVIWRDGRTLDVKLKLVEAKEQT
ncbi:MAG: trypsin-like peptidase domain-containing protein [Candidatus Krumholzibacteriota bacterium]|nr:trypsin-like peptidase domain-containing protein [Candidatus Krumholzibacteriota bacterium]